ncbi:NACHT, LRR and PYD domains-containing protein 3 isoform X1 [Hydra vulgaris]|uniref:NACHT, LRR and PYD domains-containing protein 3 isoform X1 n=2 Tax=Hydra vulgaris TaxID=6087 RepID=A0ABM4DF75_HYDVU
MGQSLTFHKKDKDFLYNKEFRLKFSNCVGVNWRTLGCWLNINDNYLDMIDYDNPKTADKAYSMLKTWIQMNVNPSLDDLKTALKKMERFDLIRVIEELTKFTNIPKNCALSKRENCAALKRFYLESCKKTFKLRPSLKHFSSINILHEFVDLSLVDAVSIQRDNINNIEREQFLKKQMSYKPIPYHELFSDEKSLLFISGSAGIGKTWLLKKILLDWSNGFICKNIDLLFYFECNKFNYYQNISSINELVHIFYEDVVKDFDINSYSIMFVIDGLDEFKYLDDLINYSFDCTYPIVKVLSEIQKHKCVVTGRLETTGRIFAVEQYQNMFSHHDDKLIIQIMGFNENSVNNYIEKNVVEDAREYIKRILRESSVAKSMASVPFYLSSMCKIIADLKQDNQFMFLTMTDLYANIFLYFLQKHIHKNDEPFYKIIEKDHNKKYILQICNIAYYLLIQNNVIFSRKEISFFIKKFEEIEQKLFGFVERIETHQGYFYQFSHLSIMEFCASLYAYNNINGEVIVLNKKLRCCLPMIYGLTNKKENTFLYLLGNLSSSNSEKISLVHIFYLSGVDDFNTIFYECFYESQSSITDEIKSFVDKQRRWAISINGGKTSYETTCEIYFVNHFINSGRKLSDLSINKKNLSDDEKNLIIKSSTNVRYVALYHPIKLDNWKPKDKIEELLIYISRYSISKEDFEHCFLPWINVCEELHLSLHYDIDFIKDIYKWLFCLNIKRVMIRYRGESFCSFEQLKSYISNINIK